MICFEPKDRNIEFIADKQDYFWIMQLGVFDRFISGPIPGEYWILQDGSWDDAGRYIDSEEWRDS